MWGNLALWAIEMGTRVFAFLIGKYNSLPSSQDLFSETENSHKCQRPYFFQNIKIKGKVSVIPMHLLSKYTAIRVSYGAWQGLQTTLRFCLFHS